MTQHPFRPPTRAPLSQLAVASLICSLILLCPVTSAVAVILGSMALRRVRMSRGRLGGRRLALAGTLIGSASLVIQGYVLIKLGDWQLRLIELRSIEGITTFIQAAQDGDVPAVRRVMGDAMSRQVPDEQITQFGLELTRKYGPLTGFRIAQRDVHSSLGASRIEVAGFFVFADLQRPGSARFLASPGGVDLAPRLLLDHLLITDVDRGDMSLPPASPDTSSSDGKPGAANSQEASGDRTMPPTKE